MTGDEFREQSIETTINVAGHTATSGPQRNTVESSGRTDAMMRRKRVARFAGRRRVVRFVTQRDGQVVQPLDKARTMLQ